jgi:hypothetical protein
MIRHKCLEAYRAGQLQALQLFPRSKEQHQRTALEWYARFCTALSFLLSQIRQLQRSHVPQKMYNPPRNELPKG